MILVILKTIGIVLACIAAFILLIALLVLFVPMTYRVKASGENTDIKAGAKVKMLFGLLSANAAYEGMSLTYCVKIAWVTVFKGELGKKDAEALKEVLKEEETSSEEKTSECAPSAEMPSADAPSEETPKEKHVKSAEIPLEGEGFTENKTEKETAEERARRFIDKLKTLYNKVKNIWEKIKTAKYIWDAPVTKNALKFLKIKAIQLFEHIKPGKITGRVTFGMEDPADTAKAYGTFNSLICMIDNRLVLVPEFENKCVRIENLNISGRIFTIYVLLLALKVLRNKDTRRVVRYIRRNF